MGEARLVLEEALPWVGRLMIQEEEEEEEEEDERRGRFNPPTHPPTHLRLSSAAEQPLILLLSYR